MTNPEAAVRAHVRLLPTEHRCLSAHPVSTAVCLARYVHSGLDVAIGAPTLPPSLVALQADYDVKPALTVFLSVDLEFDAEARQWARPRLMQGSGDFTSSLGTQGFIQTPPGPQGLKRGTLLPFYAW